MLIGLGTALSFVGIANGISGVEQTILVGFCGLVFIAVIAAVAAPRVADYCQCGQMDEEQHGGQTEENGNDDNAGRCADDSPIGEQ